MAFDRIGFTLVHLKLKLGVRKVSAIEPVLLLLAFLVLTFCGMLFAAEKFFPEDSGFFQVISGLVTGFAGALLMRVKPRVEKGDPGAPPDSTTVTTISTPEASATTETKS